jgi:hypothetical protein
MLWLQYIPYIYYTPIVIIVQLMIGINNNAVVYNIYKKALSYIGNKIVWGYKWGHTPNSH